MGPEDQPSCSEPRFHSWRHQSLLTCRVIQPKKRYFLNFLRIIIFYKFCYCHGHRKYLRWLCSMMRGAHHSVLGSAKRGYGTPLTGPNHFLYHLVSDCGLVLCIRKASIFRPILLQISEWRCRKHWIHFQPMKSGPPE
jgi:hypothetical protein